MDGEEMGTVRMRNAGLGATGGSDGRRAAEWPRGCAGAGAATRRPRGGVWGDGTEGTEGRMPAGEELGTYVSERRTALPECPRYACVRLVGGVSSRAEKGGREGERKKKKRKRRTVETILAVCAMRVLHWEQTKICGGPT